MKKSILSLFFIGAFCTSFSQNNCLNFDGSNDYVDLGNQIGNSGIRTIEMWFKPDVNITPTSHSDYTALVARNTSDETCEYALVFCEEGSGDDGKLLFYNNESLTNQDHRVMSGNNSWTAGVWYHVAVVIDPSMGMKMYINGDPQEDTEDYTSAPCSSNAVTSIGRWGDFNMRYFDGSIDEVRIWNYARSENDVNNHSGGELVGTESGLIAYYNFNQGISAGNNPTVTSLTDLTSSSYTGTLYNFQLSGNTSNWICSNNFVNVDFQNCLNFDGTNDYVNIGNQIGNSGIRTIEMWFKPDVDINSTSHTTYTSLLARNTSNETCEYALVFMEANNGEDGKLGFFCNGSSTGQSHHIVSDQNSWTAGVWYHVAAVIDATGGMKMYINGDPQTDTEAFYSSPCNHSAITALGRWGDLSIRYFDGSMDEIRFWDHARTPQNIMDNKNHELVGNEPGLICYYNFNQGISNGDNSTVTSLINAVSGSYTGTLYNFALNNGSSNWVCSDVPTQSARIAGSSLLSSGSNAEAIKLYPNPAKENITVEANGIAGTYNIQIIDITGKVVFNDNFTNSQTQINLNSLSKGIYILKVLASDKTLLTKFIKE